MTAPGWKDVSPVVALALGFLIPGGGHAYAGKWGKAILFFTLVTGLLVMGMILGGGPVILPSAGGEFRLWYFAQLGCLGPTLALTPLCQFMATREAIDWANRMYEMGTLYTAVAGFLNVLVAMDAYLRLAYPERRPEKEAA